MATWYIYGDPNTKELINFTAEQLDADSKGYRVEVAKDETHAIFSDLDPWTNYQLTTDNTDVELKP